MQAPRTSIWNRPLFRKARSTTPATETQVRVHCLGMGWMFRQTPWILAAYLLGLVCTTLVAKIGFGLSPNARRIGYLGSISWLDVWSLVRSTGLLVAVAMVAATFWLLPWSYRRVADYQVRSLTRRASKSRRNSRRVATYLIVAIIIIVVGGLVATGASTRWAVAGVSASKLMVSYSVPGIVLGLRSRRGRGVHCAKCEYPMRTWRGSPLRCPECGGLWKSRWGAYLSTRLIHWRVVWTCAGVFVAGAAIGVVAFVSIG